MAPPDSGSSLTPGRAGWDQPAVVTRIAYREATFAMTAWLHYSPTRGWMNDPNGLIHWQGRHHLFYQYNPDGTEFTNQHWGHASSADLLTWTEHEVALFPGPHESAPYDATACFSGCAFEHDGGVSILYTGVLGDRQLPCLARATDDELTGFAKDQANPVVPAPPAADITDFRDHSVWRDQEGRWRQLVAGKAGRRRKRLSDAAYRLLVAVARG